MRPSRRNGLAALALLIVYALALHDLPKGVFLSPDEGAKYLMLHSVELTREGLVYRLPYGGRRIDPEHRYYPNLGGWAPTFPYPFLSDDRQMLFHWPIWFPFFCSFVYAIFGLTGAYLLAWASGWLIAVLSGWLAERVRPGCGPPAILLVGLGTPVLFYSLTFWEHTAAGLLGLLAVVACAVRPGLPSTLLACFLIVAAALFRIEIFILGAALLLAIAASGLWALIRRPAPAGSAGIGRRLLRICLAVVVIAVAVEFAFSVFDYLPLRMQGNVRRLPERAAEIPEKSLLMPRGYVSVLINESENEGPVIEFHWAVAALGAVAVCFLAPLLPRVYLEAPALLLGLSAIIAFAAALLRQDSAYRSVHGILPIAPYGVMAVYALRAGWRSRSPVLVRLATVTLLYLAVGTVVLFMSFVYPPGTMITGLEWGQRYLLPLYPLLAVLAVVAAADYWRSQRPRILKVVVLLLVGTTMALGVYFQVRGLKMLRTNLQLFARWEKILRDDGPVFSDVWWLPVTLADLYVTHEVFFSEDPRKFEEWLVLAKAHRVRRFQFAGRGRIRHQALGELAKYRVGKPFALPPISFTAFELPARGPRRVVRPAPTWRSLPPDAGP